MRISIAILSPVIATMMPMRSIRSRGETKTHYVLGCTFDSIWRLPDTSSLRHLVHRLWPSILPLAYMHPLLLALIIESAFGKGMLVVYVL